MLIRSEGGVLAEGPDGIVWVTAEDAARRLGMSESWFKAWASSNGIPARGHGAGRGYLWSEAEALDRRSKWLTARGAQVRAAADRSISGNGLPSKRRMRWPPVYGTGVVLISAVLLIPLTITWHGDWTTTWVLEGTLAITYSLALLAAQWRKD